MQLSKIKRIIGRSAKGHSRANLSKALPFTTVIGRNGSVYLLAESDADIHEFALQVDEMPSPFEPLPDSELETIEQCYGTHCARFA